MNNLKKLTLQIELAKKDNRNIKKVHYDVSVISIAHTLEALKQLNIGRSTDL
ncbi:hypothetical protein [Virgibacillus ndiopensis]|uniref:hypothetical protein n=1 Tax=Virgibacillus ndiopensis TaxID=2004408 RepID=UPI00159BBB7E|nr:hypothetical protein [Virgibacillus ndiopensis]